MHAHRRTVLSVVGGLAALGALWLAGMLQQPEGGLPQPMGEHPTQGLRAGASGRATRALLAGMPGIEVLWANPSHLTACLISRELSE